MAAWSLSLSLMLSLMLSFIPPPPTHTATEAYQFKPQYTPSTKPKKIRMSLQALDPKNAKAGMVVYSHSEVCGVLLLKLGFDQAAAEKEKEKEEEEKEEKK